MSSAKAKASSSNNNYNNNKKWSWRSLFSPSSSISSVSPPPPNADGGKKKKRRKSLTLFTNYYDDSNSAPTLASTSSSSKTTRTRRSLDDQKPSSNSFTVIHSPVDVSNKRKSFNLIRSNHDHVLASLPFPPHMSPNPTATSISSSPPPITITEPLPHSSSTPNIPTIPPHHHHHPHNPIPTTTSTSSSSIISQASAEPQTKPTTAQLSNLISSLEAQDVARDSHLPDTNARRARATVRFAMRSSYRLDTYHPHGVLGFGANGVVMRGKSHEHGPVAIKLIYKKPSTPLFGAEFPMEVKVLMKLSLAFPHENVVKLLDAWQDTKCFYMVTELHGSHWLMDLMRDHRKERLERKGGHGVVDDSSEEVLTFVNPRKVIHAAGSAASTNTPAFDLAEMFKYHRNSTGTILSTASAAISDISSIASTATAPAAATQQPPPPPPTTSASLSNPPSPHSSILTNTTIAVPSNSNSTITTPTYATESLPISPGTSDLWAWGISQKYAAHTHLQSQGIDPSEVPPVLPDPQMIQSIFRQLAYALAHLHAVGVVHGDIKEENVLVMATIATNSTAAGVQVQAKLCDFGHAMVVSGDRLGTNFVDVDNEDEEVEEEEPIWVTSYGTPQLTPPELWESRFMPKSYHQQYYQQHGSHHHSRQGSRTPSRATTPTSPTLAPPSSSNFPPPPSSPQPSFAVMRSPPSPQPQTFAIMKSKWTTPPASPMASFSNNNVFMPSSVSVAAGGNNSMSNNNTPGSPTTQQQSMSMMLPKQIMLFDGKKADVFALGVLLFTMSHGPGQVPQALLKANNSKRAAAAAASVASGASSAGAGTGGSASGGGNKVVPEMMMGTTSLSGLPLQGGLPLPDMDKRIGKECQELIRWMTRIRPEERPSMRDVLKSVYVCGG